MNRFHFSLVLFILILAPFFLYAQVESRPAYMHYRQIETEHFQIVFEPADKLTALEIAAFCEEIYTDVTTLLDSYPSKIKVLIHGRLDMANGSYYPIPEHLNLYVTSPIDFFNGALTESWLKGLFAHELTHYIHISYEKGWIYELSKFFGPSIKTIPGAFLPGWLLEGYTTNTETLFTEGGRGRNPIFEMVYKSHILEGNLFSLKEAAYSSQTPPRGRIYISGYIFVNFLIRSYGESVLKEIHQRMVVNPFNPHKAVFDVTGKTTNQLWDEMRLELMKHYETDHPILEGTALSPYLKGNWNQPLVNDKGLLLYRTDLKHAPALVYYDPITQSERILKKVRLTDAYSFTTNSSGDQIVYSTLDANFASAGGTSYTADLFSLKGKKAKRITKNQHLWHPALSNDGSRLVAIQKDHSYSKLVEVDQNTGLVTELFSYPQATLFTPRFSPDAKKIVFVLNIQGKQDIWLYDYDTDTAKPLLMNQGSEYYPSFINDHQLLFTSDTTENLVVYQFDLHNQSISPLIEDPVGVLSAVPFQEGFLYSTYRSLGYRIFQTTPQQLSQTMAVPLFKTDALSLSDYPEERIFPEIEDKFYPNIPHLIGWTPVPFNYTEKATNESALGIGAFLAAQSLDQESYVQALLSFPFTVAQPNLFLEARFPISIIDVSYKLEHQYSSYYQPIETFNQKHYNQESFQQINFRIPIYSHNLNGRTLSLSFNAGLSHQINIDDTQPFHLFSPETNDLNSKIQKHQLIQFDGLAFQYTENSSPIAIYPELQFFASLGTQILLPALKNKETAVVGLGDFALSVPIVPDHNFFGELNLGYANIPGLAYNFAPRGYGSMAASLRGKGVGTFGYNFNFGETDLPLFSSFSLQGFAMALFLQTQFWFDETPELAQMDPHLYAGIEFMPIVGWSEGTFPITFGLNFRFDTTGREAFDASADIAPYFSINMSFINSYRDKKGSFLGRRSQASWRIE